MMALSFNDNFGMPLLDCEVDKEEKNEKKEKKAMVDDLYNYIID